MTFYLRPSEIKYSQDSICCYFSEPYNKRIGETLDELCEGRISISDIKPISVAKNKGEWVTWDNRRLWVYRHLERLGKCNRISVRQKGRIPDTRLTTTCGGNNVDVRGKPGGYWYKKCSQPSVRNEGSYRLYTSNEDGGPEKHKYKQTVRNEDFTYRQYGHSNQPSDNSYKQTVRNEDFTYRQYGHSNQPSDNSSSLLDTLWNVGKYSLIIGALLVIAAVKR